ncbi:hypothetical protein [Borreliella yangtzensis]
MKEIANYLKDGKDNTYKGIELNINQIRQLSLIQESIIEFKGTKEFSLINKMFGQFSTFSEEYIDFGVRLHLTKYKALYKEYNNGRFIFLYSGADIYQFDLRFFENKAAKESFKLLWVDKKDFKKVLTKDN